MFDVRAALSAWELDIPPTLGVAVAALAYAAAVPRRGTGGTWPRRRTAAFVAGLLVMLVAADGPPDVYAGRSFSAHMVQHLLLQLVAAPLLLLGAPVRRILRADPVWMPRRRLTGILRARALRPLGRPVVALLAFAVILVGSHLSPLYELALRHPAVHQIEHVAYLASACLFWWPVIGSDPVPGRPAAPARMLYLLLMMPVMALLGVAIAGSDRLLYPHYATHLPPWGGGALVDQQAAGTLMWIAGMVSIPPALVVVLLRWLDEEERVRARGTGGWTAARATGG